MVVGGGNFASLQVGCVHVPLWQVETRQVFVRGNAVARMQGGELASEGVFLLEGVVETGLRAVQLFP